MRSPLFSTLFVGFVLLAAATGRGQLITPHLPGNWVTGVVGENAAEVWFSSLETGLWKYDGKEFNSIPILPSDGSPSPNDLADVIFDNNGRLWVASKTKGLFIRTGTTWKHVAPDSGAPDNRLTTLFKDSRGRIWIGTETNGVGMFDGVFWHRINSDCYDLFENNSWKPCRVSFRTPKLSSNQVNAVAEDGREFIWFGTSVNNPDNDSGAKRFSGNFAGIDSNSEWCTGLRGSYVTSLTTDQEGKIWAGTSNQGAFKFQLDCLSCPSSNTLCPDPDFNPSNSPLRDHTVTDIAVDHESNLWFAASNGVHRYNPRTRSWRSFSEKEHPFFVNVQTIFTDADNNLWFGLNESLGVLRLNNNWITLVDSGPLKNFAVSSLMAGDTLWLGTKAGLVRYQGEKNLGTQLINLQISSLSTGKVSKVWAGVFGNDAQGGGIYGFDWQDRLQRRYPVDPSGQGVNSELITEVLEHEQRIWVATLRGLNHKVLLAPDTSSWKYETVLSSNGGLLSDSVTALAFRDGKLWCGTVAGVSVFDPQSNSWELSYTTANGLRGNGVSDLAIDPRSKDVWVGTSNGVSIFDGSRWTHFDRLSGLADNLVTQVVFADSGDEVWVATRNGVSQRRGNGPWITFTESSGLASNFVQTLALQGDSLRWFGTWGAGLTRYRPPQSKPETFIDSRLDVTDKSEVVYYFSAADLNTAGDEFRYRYWLDKEPPSLPTSNRFAVVQVPQPGAHTFYVQAIDRDGHLDPKPASDFFHRILPEKGGLSRGQAYFAGLDTVIAEIYWPPNVLGKDTEIIIQPSAIMLHDSALFAFDLSSNLSFERDKHLLLSFTFRASNGLHGPPLGIYQEAPAVDRRGGTPKVHGDSLTIKTAITQLGTYSVRKENAANIRSGGGRAVVDAQPRVFSPRGGGHAAETALIFELSSPAPVKVKVYNLAGRLIKMLMNEQMAAGINTAVWNGRDDDNRICPSGLYLIVVESSAMSQSPAQIKVMVLNE